MASNQKEPTLASLAKDLDTLAKRVVQQGVNIQDLRAAGQDQQTWNDLQNKRILRLAETDETIDSFLSQTHGQLQRLQVQCQTFVTGKTFLEETDRQGRALDEAARQAYLTLQRELRNEWAAKLVIVTSELAHLTGKLQGATEQLLKNDEHSAERLDLLDEKVFAPTWRDRLGELWWRMTHWREARNESVD